MITFGFLDHEGRRGEPGRNVRSALTDEKLKDRAIEQALAGDFIEARHTIERMVDRRYLREAWQSILSFQRNYGDVQDVKETIVSCPDDSLLVIHKYRELPLHFARSGNVAGAIEIAKTMGHREILSLLMIPVALATKGDFVGAREAVSHINDEAWRSIIVNMMDKLQRKGKGPEKFTQR